MPPPTIPNGADETIQQYQRVMREYAAVKSSMDSLFAGTDVLCTDPGIAVSVTRDFRRKLIDLQKAQKDMIDDLCTAMMEDLIPIGMEALGVKQELCDEYKAMKGKHGNRMLEEDLKGFAKLYRRGVAVKGEGKTEDSDSKKEAHDGKKTETVG